MRGPIGRKASDMLAMNPKDAQGMLEDVAALGLLNRRNEPAYVGPTAKQIAETQGERDLRSQMYKLATREIQTNNALVQTKAQLDEVADKLNKMANRFNDTTAVSRAARIALDALADQLARVTGEDPAKVRLAAYGVMARAYDKEVGEMLSVGYLKTDPRIDPEVKKSGQRATGTIPRNLKKNRLSRLSY
jgi:hypothetical protein